MEILQIFKWKYCKYLNGNIVVFIKLRKLKIMEEIKCQDCGEEFTFTTKDEEYYKEQRFQKTKKVSQLPL